MSKFNAEQPTVALFDLDYTLISSDCTAHWLRYMLTRSRYRKALILLLLPIIKLCEKSKVSLATRNSFYLWAATAFLGKQRYATFRQQAANYIIQQKGVTAYQHAYEAIRWHRQQGHTIIIVTGALRWLARDMCKALNLEFDHLLGSSDQYFLGGRISKTFCYHANKVTLLENGNHLNDDQVRYGYSDSSADIPMLALCQHRYLVNPKDKCFAKMQHAFGDDATMVSWHIEKV
ncbi:HAD-IB family phosphatase [Alteromonas facilis]|uniref:HAD-IB family phosphatase n=1 Tax=Alteromonas facilis TaxID=2048004 RepID=UPI0013DCAC83|nr:HAD-IB family phosphatase [Alteromonas facilis]